MPGGAPGMPIPPEMLMAMLNSGPAPGQQMDPTAPQQVAAAGGQIVGLAQQARDLIAKAVNLAKAQPSNPQTEMLAQAQRALDMALSAQPVVMETPTHIDEGSAPQPGEEAAAQAFGGQL